jgi:hypothetical protein
MRRRCALHPRTLCALYRARGMKADSRRGPHARKDPMIVLDDADLKTRRNSVTLQGTIEIALVPVGATEQRGPYLALATDYVVAHRSLQRGSVQP